MPTNTCTHEGVTTLYCSDCGKKVGQQTPLEELLNHCRVRERILRTTAKGQRDRAEKLGDNWRITKAELIEANAEKWKAWGNALEGIIQRGKNMGRIET